MSERLDDENQENREEAVRCLGSLLHLVAGRKEQVNKVFDQSFPLYEHFKLQDENKNKSLDNFIGKVLSRLVLHMDDESESYRNIVLGCIIALPATLNKNVREAVKKAQEKQVHKEPLEKLIKKIGDLSL